MPRYSNPLPDINDVRNTVAGALARSSDELSDARVELASVEEAISKLQADFDKLTQLEEIASGKQPTKTGSKRGKSSSGQDVPKPKRAKKTSGSKGRISLDEDTTLEVLRVIRTRQGEATPSEIADTVGLTPVNAGRIVSQLEQHELVRITKSKQDGRKRLIDVTMRGSAVVESGSLALLKEEPAFPAAKESSDEAPSNEPVSAASEPSSEKTEESTSPETSSEETPESAVEESIEESDQSQNEAEVQEAPDPDSDGTEAEEGALSGYASAAIAQQADPEAETDIPSSEELADVEETDAPGDGTDDAPGDVETSADSPEEAEAAEATEDALVEHNH